MTDRKPCSRDFRLREWTVSPDLNQISRKDEKVVLQNLSLQVLVYLAGRRGEVVTYTELLDNLWPNRYVGEDAIHRRISDLRSHLGDDRRNPRFIETISKKGLSARGARGTGVTTGTIAMAMACGCGRARSRACPAANDNRGRLLTARGTGGAG